MVDKTASKKEELHTIREIGRVISGTWEGYKETRLGANNRIRDVVRKKVEGISFDKKEAKKEEKEYDSKYTDAQIPKLIKELISSKKVTKREAEYLQKFIELRNAAQKVEEQYKVVMSEYIENEDIWKGFLKHVRGISMILSTQLIKEFGYCERFAKPSSMNRYCGFHLVCPECTYEKEFDDGSTKVMAIVAGSDGICPNCNKKGIAPKRKRGQGIDYNPKARTLVWKVADSFIKQRSPIYAAPAQTSKGRTFQSIYHVYKDKQLQRLAGEKNVKNHAHMRAMRKVCKIFIQHYWAAAREFAGLELRKPFVDEHMGKEHHKFIIYWKDVVDANELAKDKGIYKGQRGKKI